MTFFCLQLRVRKQLPTCNPVSIRRATLQEYLAKENSGYLVCEKTDGVRYYLFLTQTPGGTGRLALLLNRALEMWVLPSQVDECLLTRRGTLLDGEMVPPIRPGGPVLFQAYDLLWEQGSSLMKDQFWMRYARLQVKRKWCARLYVYLSQQMEGRISLGNNMAFSVKTMFPCNVHGLVSALKRAQDAPYYCDGLVFTPTFAEAKLGKDNRVLKWKTHHTVDFSVQWIPSLTQENASLLFLSVLEEERGEGGKVGAARWRMEQRMVVRMGC